MTEITTDLAQIDLAKVHAWLTESYWAEGRTLETVEKSAKNSLNFGALLDGRLVGYARVVTDRATFAWLCDVIVDEWAQGKGVGKALVQAVVAHPELLGLRRIVLATRDAQGLYAQHGFEPLPNPERWMVKPG